MPRSFLVLESFNSPLCVSLFDRTHNFDRVNKVLIKIRLDKFHFSSNVINTAMPHFLLRKLDVIETRRVILTGYDVTVFITYEKLTRTSFSSRASSRFKACARNIEISQSLCDR